MQHEILDKHQIIAWDVDGTLVANERDPAPNAAGFLRYILDHPEKKHFLVTFRDPAWAAYAYKEIAHVVPQDRIAGLHACPQHLWRAYHNPKLRDDHPDVIGYAVFKAKVCTEIGATLLVDDMVEIVSSGCARYGIELLNALDPWTPHAKSTLERKGEQEA